LFFVGGRVAEEAAHAGEVVLVGAVQGLPPTRQTNRPKHQLIFRKRARLITEKVLNLAHLFMQIQGITFRLLNIFFFIIRLHHPRITLHQLRVDDLGERDDDD